MIIAMVSVGLAWVLGFTLAMQNLKVIKENNERKFGAKRKALENTNES